MKIGSIKENLDIEQRVAIRTSTRMTATVPQRTNLVKLFQVFLWLSLSIFNLFLSSFKFWVFFIYYVNSPSPSN